MSSSTKVTQGYPSDISTDPTSEPKPSSAQSLPPNNDARMEKHAEATNPTKGGGKISEGTASVGKEGDVGGGEKGMGDKIKDKLPGV